MSEAECCTICKDPLIDKTTYCLPECGHTFHTECIVHWFREQQTRCPLCNHPGAYVPLYTLHMRLSAVLKKARAENNASILKEFAKLSKLQAKLRAANRKYRMFMRSVSTQPFKQAQQTADGLREACQKIRFEIFSKKTTLDEAMPVVPIIIVTRPRCPATPGLGRRSVTCPSNRPSLGSRARKTLRRLPHPHLPRL